MTRCTLTLCKPEVSTEGRSLGARRPAALSTTSPRSGCSPTLRTAAGWRGPFLTALLGTIALAAAPAAAEVPADSVAPDAQTSWEFGPAPEPDWVVSSDSWAEAPEPQPGQKWIFERIAEGSIAWAGQDALGGAFAAILDTETPWIAVPAAQPGSLDPEAIAAWAAALSEGTILRVRLTDLAAMSDLTDKADSSDTDAARAAAAAAANAAALERARQMRPGESGPAGTERPRRRLSREAAAELGLQIFGRS